MPSRDRWRPYDETDIGARACRVECLINTLFYWLIIIIFLGISIDE